VDPSEGACRRLGTICPRGPEGPIEPQGQQRLQGEEGPRRARNDTGQSPGLKCVITNPYFENPNGTWLALIEVRVRKPNQDFPH
jgi:hypothetical protein